MIAKTNTKTLVFESLIVVLGLSFVSIIIFTSWFINQEKNIADKIYPNVYIDGKNVGYFKKSDFKSILDARNQSLNKINIYILYKSDTIATFSGQTLKLGSNLDEIVERAYLVGRSPLPASRLYQKLITLSGQGRFDFYTKLNYDQAPIDDFLGMTHDRYDKPARNALFKFENNRVVNFRQEEKGLTILTDDFLTDFNKEIKDLNKKYVNKTLVLKDKILIPEITLAKANSFGIEEFVAEGKSDYTHSIPERIYNLELASSKFDGVLVPQGKEFSFNDTVGDISSSTGYKPAYIIKNGRTVLGDGGGVCQVSTTLFRLALNAGLPITERHAHDYRVSYYENDSKPGFDATVFGGYADLKFKNDTPTALLIQTELDKENNILIFKFYGKKDDRRVELSEPQVYDFQPAPPDIYQEDPTLKKGVTKQIDWAVAGAKAKFDYKVYKGTNKIIDTSFFSSYRPWSAVYLVGTQD